MNLACFLLKIGSAPNFRPGFKFFGWQTALAGSLMSAAAMFFIDETYAAAAICLVVFLFSLIHYLSPPKRWGDVSQNLMYHQVRKYLLRLRPEHIKFWRPQIILLINNPRRQTRLIQFCNSMKKGSLYILGHVIVTDDFNTGVHEAKLQQNAWTNYISEVPRLKAFVQLTMSPSINWGVRNLILSAGLGGMRPNIAVLGFYNMDELRRSRPPRTVPEPPSSPVATTCPPESKAKAKSARRHRRDTSARILEGFLPTDVIRTEDMMSATNYMTILEDLTLRYKLNVAVGKGFDKLETPLKDGSNTKKYIDLWPIQMSAEILSNGKSVLTTNFDTYTLILQLGYILSSVPAWKTQFQLRVLVFVEYESEVEEEQARVRALLEKLRIEAEVHVSWLACGELKTYELIVNGRSDDIGSEFMVDDILQHEEWWNELQRYRGRPASMSSSQERSSLTAILDATAGRPGVYNPHTGSEDVETRRRPSVVDLLDMQAKPTMSKLSRLGVNVGIHTQHLGDEVFDEQFHQMENLDTAENSSDCDSTSGSELDLESDSDASEGRHNAVDGAEAARRPLLGRAPRQRSEADSRYSRSKSDPKTRSSRVRSESREPGAQSYGTMPRRILTEMEEQPKLEPCSSKTGGDGTAPVGKQSPPLPTSPLSPVSARPTLSTQSSAVRFSSRPMPETTTNVEDAAGPTIMFAESAAEPLTSPSRSERPVFSRQSSAGRFSSRLMPGTKITSDETGPRISFADPTYYSRKSSAYSNVDHDTSLNMPELVESYRSDASGGDDGAPYSTQNVALSFNDLPSRAQHVILNELMRIKSEDAAVLMSTLPIPAEGTSSSEEATLMYLSDIEVLCNELPPILLVLSNSMTVTVGL